MSSQRHKSVKSGNSINNIMSIQEKQYDNLLKMIETDDFYNAPEIIEERKKLYSLNTLINKAKQNLEIKLTRDKIVNKRGSSLKPESALTRLNNNVDSRKSAFERLYPKILSETYNEKAELIKREREIVKRIRKSKFSTSKSRERGSVSSHSLYSKSTQKKEKQLKLEKEFPGLNNEYGEILNNECNLFMTQMTGYNKSLEYIRDKMENNEKALSKFITKPEELKLINYNTNAEKPKVKVIVKKDEVDVQLLIQHTRNKKKNIKDEKRKLAAKAAKLKELELQKAEEKKELEKTSNKKVDDIKLTKFDSFGNSDQIKSEDKSKNISNSNNNDKNSQEAFDRLKEKTQKILENELNKMDNKNKKSKTTYGNFNNFLVQNTPGSTVYNHLANQTDHMFIKEKNRTVKDFKTKDLFENSERLNNMAKKLTSLKENNTINIVQKEIISGCNLLSALESKKNKLEQVMNLKIQTAEDVERKINDKARMNKTTKLSQYNPELIHVQDNMKKQNLFKEYYRTAYENKKEKWIEEDKQIDLKEKQELDQVRENRLLINNIRKRDRFNNLYSDQYSLRSNKNDNINNLILDFNKELGRKAYNKKVLNNKIDEFLGSLSKFSTLNKEDS